MTGTRTLAIGVGVLLLAQAAQSQDRALYRTYRLGNDLTSIAALAEVPAAGARTVHLRPSLIQELEWRQPYVMSGSTVSPRDPVQRILFTFYDDQLFRLVISYDRQRTNGLTDADMVEALSVIYGAASPQSPVTSPPALTGATVSEFGPPIAQWGDVDYSVGLYRSSFASDFRVVVASPRLQVLAQRASTEAIRLNEREAPQREIDRKNREAEDTRASQEKARRANKATFLP